MAASSAQPGPQGAAGAQWGPGRTIAVVAASLVALIGGLLLLAGIAFIVADFSLPDDDGYYTSDTERIATPTAAITAERVQLGELNDSSADRLVDEITGDVRIRATAAGAAPLFVGIAREPDVRAYLDGVAHDEIADYNDGTVQLDRRSGSSQRLGAPATAGIWDVSRSGSGTQTLDWDTRAGTWSAVVMRPDAGPGVAADIDIGAKVGWVLGVGIGMLVGGLLLMLLAAVGIWAAVTSARRAAAGAGPAVATAGAVPAAAGGAPAHPLTAAVLEGAPYPVQVGARLDEPLSRWLWLVKWLLAIPHYVVLTFLGIASVVLTLFAFFAILVTGRYPRGIFEFNVGVLRWSWRVTAYAFALTTDRYPPFTLERTDYPAELDVPYPERLSRLLVLVKSWLLAIPHLIVVSAITGTILPVLAVVAGVMLLVTGRYPPDLLEVIVGLNRWVLRVYAYVALMRDEYPPFRLTP